MQKLTKFKIAEYQLADAVELFNGGKYVSALALAGAAHEIFDSLRSRKCKITSMKERLGIFKKLSRPWLGYTPADSVYRKFFNHRRNSIKHLDDNQSEITTFSISDVRGDARSFISLASRDMAELVGKHGYSCSRNTTALVAAFNADTRNA